MGAQREDVTDQSAIRNPQSAIVVGLLGGVGSGKSEAARLFREEGGAVIVSGDALGHEALRQPDLKARIVNRFGDGILDETGEIRRRTLGGIVFADEKGRQALEAIVHPYIKDRLRQEVSAAFGLPGVRLVVVDAAVMIEAGWDDVCDELVFVDVPRDVRLERIRRTRGWTEKEVESRERVQMSLTEKARRARHTLDNSGPPDALRRQVRDLLRTWGLAREKPEPETPPALRPPGAD